MKGKGIALLSVLFLLASSSLLHAQATEEMTLTELSSTISRKLIDLKKNSAIVTEQLKTLSENLEQSQAEANRWKEQSMKLSNSLENITEELNRCYMTMNEYETTITKQKEKLSLRIKIVWILIIILGLRVISMIVGFILCSKGISVPRWLDILL